MPDASEFAVGFREAISFLRGRLDIPEERWRAILAGADAAARDAADRAAEALRQDMLRAILEIVEEGGTAADFRDDYDRIVAEHGWADEDENPGWRANLIFRVQTANARAAGRWAQIQRLKRVRPFLRYVTAGDERVRETHREWHNVVLPVDHPWWLTHYPPNGFNCRCFVQSLSERDLARYGYEATPDSDPRLAVPPDPGWSGNVGMAWEQFRG